MRHEKMQAVKLLHSCIPTSSLYPRLVEKMTVLLLCQEIEFLPLPSWEDERPPTVPEAPVTVRWFRSFLSGLSLLINSFTS